MTVFDNCNNNRGFIWGSDGYSLSVQFDGIEYDDEGFTSGVGNIRTQASHNLTTLRSRTYAIPQPTPHFQKPPLISQIRAAFPVSRSIRRAPLPFSRHRFYSRKETMMKTTLKISMLALSMMMPGAAFAGEAKDGVKPVQPPKVDMITTQSIEPVAIEPAADATNCNAAFTGFKAMKACGDASAYPGNPMSGLNLN
jgi:hypothetical protein